MSANHNQDFQRAVKLIEAAKVAGADAVKVQTYTPDTITIDCDNEYFRIKGTLWDGCTLYGLYRRAYMPWDWYPRLKEVAQKLGIDLFSSPFDASAVNFLEEMNVPAYKVASSELIDIPLLKKIALTGKPVIMSTGMATKEEISDAVEAVRGEGNNQIALLKCTAAYPALPEEMNLKTIPQLAAEFGVPVGLSDHSLDIEIPVAAVALGASIIEKHFTLSRQNQGIDSQFSLEPAEFKNMVDSVRKVEKALGEVKFGCTEREKISREYRRSLFVVEDVRAGEEITEKNVRSIRPGQGLAPRLLNDVLGRKARCDLKKGTPLAWDMLE
jgi:pseudaminic acid synthase